MTLPRNDVFSGASHPDDACGRSGADQLGGSAGNDMLFGEDGADCANGGLGDDQLRGGAGYDYLQGNDGNDYADGEVDSDRLTGGGNDYLQEKHGNDRVHGGIGNDRLRGGPGNDVLIDDAGRDQLYGTEYGGAARVRRWLSLGPEPGERRRRRLRGGASRVIERLRQPLAAALEPTGMGRSSANLLRTFLGDGPADAVLAGAIRRGDRRHIEAAIMFADLRGFTAMTESLGEADLFAALDRYFEAVVEAVRCGCGDVLKFLGDGILAIFSVEAVGSRAAACRAALRAVDHARERLAGAAAADGTFLAFTATLHVGQVFYGNIGSPDRLDFTVLGQAVNLVSRLEGLAKELDRPLLCSAAFAAALDAPFASLGRFPLKGVTEPEEVFAPADGPADL